MSCISLPLPPLEHDHDHDDGRTRAPALDLLDEYWFFSNTLGTNNNNSAKKKKKPPPQLPPRSPSTATATATGEKASSGSAGLGARRLLRTPSLPTSRCGVGMTMTMELPSNSNKDGDGDEVDDDDLNWSSIYEGVLRTRMAEGGGGRSSALRRAPSMPVPTVIPNQVDGDGRRQSKSTLRHSHSTLGSGRHTPAPRTTTKDKQDKKWKSSSDLESIDVLPGLKHQIKMTQSPSTSPRPPYLSSEAWRPALARAQSAAEMKDQLRMWAQAVACNVRYEQEC